MRISQLQPSFVKFIPSDIDDGILYISMEFKIMVHKCPCGCGNNIFTPIDMDNGWTIYYDGNTVSLKPSIGNWSLKCKSHYYITENQVQFIGDKKNRIINTKYLFKFKKKKKNKNKGGQINE